MTSPLKSAKGLGSAKHGLSHWIAQRVTAIALVPLTIWFISIIAFMKNSNYDTAIETVSNKIKSIQRKLDTTRQHRKQISAERKKN